MEDTVINTTRKRAFSGLALLGASALVLAGCAAAPEEEAPEETEALDFYPCMVSDAGGFDDRSFNEAAFNGLEEAAAELGVEFNAVESADENAYEPNVEGLVAEGCDIIVVQIDLFCHMMLRFALKNVGFRPGNVVDAILVDWPGQAVLASMRLTVTDEFLKYHG